MGRKFKVGDKIILKTDQSAYLITNNCAICEVLAREKSDYGNIKVRVVGYISEQRAKRDGRQRVLLDSCIGMVLQVEEKLFEYYYDDEHDPGFRVGDRIQLSPSARRRGEVLSSGFIHGVVSEINSSGYMEITCTEHENPLMIGYRIHWVNPKNFVKYSIPCYDEVSFNDLF